MPASAAFSLQSVLTVRQATVERCRIALRAAEQAEADVQQQMAELVDQQQHVQRERRQMLGSKPRVDLSVVRSCQRYEQQLKRRLHLLRSQLDDASAEVRQQQQALTRADRAVRVLERLSEKQLANAAREFRHAESQRSHEMIVQRFRGVP